MEGKINNIKSQLIIEYIEKIDEIVGNYDFIDNTADEIFDLIIEISNVMQNELPEIQSSILLRNGTEIRDANTVRAMLVMYLANNGIKYTGKEKEENAKIKRFWSSFILWFETELVSMELLKPQYLRWDNWDGGMWFLEMDYDYEFRLHRGVDYPVSLKDNTGSMEDIKTFIELAYKNWIINDGKSHYAFTVEVNERLKIFKLPYRLQNGILLKQGYKTTHGIDKIINYRMFERKIRFSEDMINSHDMMEKKSA